MKQPENIFEKLSEISLPQLPQVLIQLIDICKSDDVDIRLVAQTVAQDIAITTKTLKLANSAFLGARSQFKNIDQAVIFLGVDTVRNLAISVSVHEVFGNNRNISGFNAKQFWYHSLLTALISKTIAQKSGYDDPGAAYLTGLLHDTGKYLLCQHYGEPYIKLLNQYSADPLVAAEKKAFEISHPDVGHYLLHKWNMSEELSLAVRDHHNIDGPDTEASILGRILRLSNTLTKKPASFDKQTIKDASILCIAPASLAGIVEEQTGALDDLAQTLAIQIQEPEEPQQAVATDVKDMEGLGKKVAVRAQLYGFMDNIIKANTQNRVFLTFEESLSLLFDCNHTVLLLPQDNNIYRCEGSFRNRAAKQLKVDECSYEPGTPLLDRENHSQELSQLKVPTTIDSESNPKLSRIFAALEVKTIFVLPIRISQERLGMLLLGLNSENETVVDKEETLQLLCSHVGNRLYQEALKEEYANNFAKERISAVEEMARSIAHEISNPLAVVQNYLTLLTRKNGHGEQVGDELLIINKELERIATISNQLNDLSQGTEQRNSTAVDINHVISDVVSLYQHSSPSGGVITIDFTPNSQLPLLWLEENPLRQILANLITNSIDALGERGVIEILCQHIPKTEALPDGEIVIVVSDNGAGIPPSIANTIFRAGTTTKSDGHAGLGLAIVNKLTKDLSGRIYHSTGKQGHTQFTLHLPIRQPAS